MKRLITVLLLACLLLPMFSFGASARVYEGRALDEDYILGGSNDEEEGPMPDAGMDSDDDEAYALAPAYDIHYTLDTETDTLRIFTGSKFPQQKMLSYVRTSWIPWQKALYKKDIQTAVIEEGVLSVGRYSFFRCNNLQTVYLPHSLRKVDRVVFYQCAKLDTIYYAGNREDFARYVTWIDSYNYYTTPNGKEERAYDKIHFGESVTVKCVDENGDVLYRYTVGGYFVGDEYTITPPALDGMTYLGNKTEIKGKFKENDKTVITLKYECNHQYEIANPDRPCGSVCKYCGKLDPSVTGHEWDVLVLNERSFTSDRTEMRVCRVCKNSETLVAAKAYYWYLLYGAVGAAVLITALGVALAVVARKRRKQ